MAKTNEMTHIKRVVTRTQSGQRRGGSKFILVSGGRQFKYIGSMVAPNTGDNIKNVWSLRRHNSDEVIVNRDDVETAMFEHGYSV